MKTAQNREQRTQQEKETRKCLEAIESLIRSKTFRELGFEKLNELDTDTLSPEHLVHYHYLNGRYCVYLYKQNQDIEHLEWANDFFDDMVSIAYENKVRIQEIRFLFSRAHVKFQLSRLVWDEERKPWLLEKAKHITNTVLKFNPKNESFLWLKLQLQP